MKYLTMEAVIAHHDRLVLETGGATGLRDFGLLSSAIAAPSQSWDGEDLYSDIFEKSCAYLFHLIKNHPFIDGNKRTAVICFIDFLWLNDCQIDFDFDFLYTLALDIAENKLEKGEVIQIVKKFAGCEKSINQ